MKSPRTVIKRASSLLAFFDWLRKHGQQLWPFEIDNISVYIGDFAADSKGYTRGATFLQACRFAHHVLRIALNSVLNDPILSGRSSRLESMKAATKRARILSLVEVRKLEAFLFSDSDLYDRYLTGCILFAIFSRSRWSDLNYLDFLELDVTETPEGPYGYIESGAKFQKAGTSSLKKALVMPLVVPIIHGTLKTPWALRFWEILKECGVDVDASPFGALCRAPLKDGRLGKRPIDTEEVSKFLCNVLGLEGEQRTSSHSFKATTLAWASRFGMEEDARVLLGHHEHQSTRPIKLYESMLLTIRNDAFAPDTTRSGFSREPVVQQPVIKIEDTDEETSPLCMRESKHAREDC